MGDFTVCGFYSRLPIERGEEAIAIICHDDLELKPSNIPCYSRSSIIPYCLPIYGKMGDYGALDNVEESETIKALENLCKESILDILEILTRVDCWGNDNDETKKLFKKLESDPIWYLGDRTKGHRFYVIYEHKSIYLKIAEEIDLCNADTKKYLDIIKDHKIKFNIFRDDFLTSGELTSLFSEMIDFQKEYIKKKNRPNYKVHDMMTNYSNTAQMILYDKVKYTLDQDMINEIIKWCGFLLCFDFNCHGLFTFSSNSNQSWHHDREYKKFRNKLLKEYKEILNKKYE